MNLSRREFILGGFAIAAGVASGCKDLLTPAPSPTPPLEIPTPQPANQQEDDIYRSREARVGYYLRHAQIVGHILTESFREKVLLGIRNPGWDSIFLSKNHPLTMEEYDAILGEIFRGKGKTIYRDKTIYEFPKINIDFKDSLLVNIYGDTSFYLSITTPHKRGKSPEQDLKDTRWLFMEDYWFTFKPNSTINKVKPDELPKIAGEVVKLPADIRWRLGTDYATTGTVLSDMANRRTVYAHIVDTGEIGYERAQF